MKKNELSKIALKLMFGIAFLPMLGFAQKEERFVSQLSWKDDPVKIVGLKTKNKTIELDKKFFEREDWLKGLTVTVKNISDKPISRIEIDLAFPRPKVTSKKMPTYTIKVSYGRDPSDVDAAKHKQILPGDNVDVKLLEVNLPFIKTDLLELGYSEKITHAQITVDMVTFSDGTAWSGGDILYPDPNNPKQKFNP